MAEEIYIARQSTLEEVKNAVGSPSDSGDTTAMGKLNKIISSAEGGFRFYEGIMATLTGKSTSSSKPAVELKADGTTILSITNSSSVATETKTAVLAVSAGVAVTISGVMGGYSTNIANIKFMADVISDKADISVD